MKIDISSYAIDGVLSQLKLNSNPNKSIAISKIINFVPSITKSIIKSITLKQKLS